jgi:hypothetical protein
MRTLFLFMHIVGVLILFGGLALEALGLRQLRRSGTLSEAAPWLLPFSLTLRLYPVALAVLLLTGGYLASNVGVWQFGWVRISMPTLVIIAVVGMIAAVRVRRLYQSLLNAARTGAVLDGRLRAPWLAGLLGARGAAALGILYVMVSKPDGVSTLIVIVSAAALVGATATVLAGRPAKAATDVSPGGSDIEDYAAPNRQES